MKGSKAFGGGILIGLSVSCMSLPLQIDQTITSLAAFSLLFLFSTGSIFVFSIRGWPEHYPGFDYYDLHRVIIGGSLTLGVLGVLMKAGEKLSQILSITLVSGFVVALSGLALYLLLGAGLVYALRRV